MDNILSNEHVVDLSMIPTGRALDILRGDVKSSDILAEKMLEIILMDDEPLEMIGDSLGSNGQVEAGIVPGVPDGTGPLGDTPACPLSDEDAIGEDEDMDLMPPGSRSGPQDGTGPLGDTPACPLSDDIDDMETSGAEDIFTRIEEALEDLRLLVADDVDVDAVEFADEQEAVFDNVEDVDEIVIVEMGQEELRGGLFTTRDEILSLGLEDDSVFKGAFAHLQQYQRVQS